MSYRTFISHSSTKQPNVFSFGKKHFKFVHIATDDVGNHNILLGNFNLNPRILGEMQLCLWFDNVIDGISGYFSMSSAVHNEWNV